MINDTPKYILHSMQSVAAWMEEEVQQKQMMLQRKYQNFGAFIATVESGKKRPELEHFEGVEGVKKAYNLLLERGHDFVHYGPTLWLAEEDPLREFRVQYFRERHKRSIFSRAITHDTPLGRRFQSRDPYEYRKTILVDEDVYPFSFEKIITGDTVACFQLNEMRACFIRFPELAEEERVFFERLWNKKSKAPQSVPNQNPALPALPEGPKLHPVITIPVPTRALSQLRQFFLSRKSMAMFAVFAVLAAGITYGIHSYNISLNTKRIQDTVKSIAATGALQFDPNDLEKLQTPEDVTEPEYAKVIYQLNLIRNQNEGVKYIYILRPTNDPAKLAFVADADSLDLKAKKDLNQDGTVDQKDQLSPPGELYDVNDNSALSKAALGEVTIDEKPYSDQWGTFISGHAPISKNNVVVAVLGVDIEAERVNQISTNSFLSAVTFLGFFIFFTIIRLAAFNRSIVQEIKDLFTKRKTVITLLGGFIIVSMLTIGWYFIELNADITSARERILTIAKTASLQFSAEDLETLRTIKDIEKPQYQKVVNTLHEIRLGNKNIKYVYLIRPNNQTTTFEFIADADGYNRNLFEEFDMDNNGMINSSDETPYPGLQYDIGHISTLKNRKYFTPIVTEKPYEDKWGAVFTGYAPIKDINNGKIVGILAVDVDATDVYQFKYYALLPLVAFVIVVIGFLLLRPPTFNMSLLLSIINRINVRKTITIVVFIFMLIYWLVFGIYFSGVCTLTQYPLHVVGDRYILFV